MIIMDRDSQSYECCTSTFGDRTDFELSLVSTFIFKVLDMIKDRLRTYITQFRACVRSKHVIMEFELYELKKITVK